MSVHLLHIHAGEREDSKHPTAVGHSDKTQIDAERPVGGEGSILLALSPFLLVGLKFSLQFYCTMQLHTQSILPLFPILQSSALGDVDM